jgi:signal transduction histidine kinase
MKIEDNGKGFDITALTHRNGIRNLQQRAEKWRGTAKIDSLTGQGTTIDIYFPIIT